MIKTISISVNVRDSFHGELSDETGETIHYEHGYTPSWMPGKDYGALAFQIDNQTGRILNWVPIPENFKELEEAD